jgi:hypothetical protein
MPAIVENCRSIGPATEALRAGAGQRRGDLDGGEIDARQGGDGEQSVRKDAEHDDRGRDQRGQHRPPDAGFRQSHFRS